MTGRSDPKGKRALFEAPPAEIDDPLADDALHDPDYHDGQAALFSTGEHQSGTGIIDCSHCGTKTRASHVDIGVRIALISLWIPGKHFSRWMQCPNCQRRSWCRVEWWR
ncbi:MAG: hypothetical protein WBN24_02445 [Acidimicrobiia bacterium]